MIILVKDLINEQTVQVDLPLKSPQKPASAQGIPGWYVFFCVESDSPRQLIDAEEKQVRAFRFGAPDLFKFSDKCLGRIQ